MDPLPKGISRVSIAVHEWPGPHTRAETCWRDLESQVPQHRGLRRATRTEARLRGRVYGCDIHSVLKPTNEVTYYCPYFTYEGTEAR